MNDFQKFSKDHNVSPLFLTDYMNFQNSYISPVVTEERKNNVAQMDVFSRLMIDRIIFLGCEVTADVANIIQAQLLFLDNNEPGTEISLFINSPGGSVYDGLGIYDTMQLIKSPVSTTCTGMAASMAAILLAAGESGKRSMLPHSRTMIHQPLGGIRGQASDIEITAKQISKLKTELYSILSSHTGKPIDIIEKDADRDFWMDAKEALDYGMIDKILRKN